MNDSSSRRASYRASDFRASEVQIGQGWSTKAEVFPFGFIACKVLNYRLAVSKERPPKEILSFLEEELRMAQKTSELIAQILPAAFKKAIEPCLSDSPTARPDMKAVVRALEDLFLDFDISPGEEKRLRWTYWDWNQSCYEGRRRTTSGIDRASTRSFNTGNIDNLSLDS